MATIVVADDDELIVRLLALILEGEGHRVLRAGDGTKALALLRAERPDLLIADHIMPHPSGGELLALLRAEPALAVPSILMSAFDPPPSAGGAFPVAFLHKPFDVANLLATVERLLGDAPMRHDGR